MQKLGILVAVALLVVGCDDPSVAPPAEQELVASADPSSPEVEPAAAAEPVAAEEGAGPFVGQAMGRGAPTDEDATPMEPALRVALVRSMMAEAATDARYAFARRGSAVEAMHASQDLRARFRAEQLTLTDEQGEQPIRVSLSEVNGRPAGRASLHTEGNRVELRRAGLTEWYVHGSLGLEQGFTLERAPAGAADEVLLAVAVDAPGYTVAESAEGIELTHESRQVSVRDFYAEDATGRLLEAEMSWRGEALELRVSLEGARYPVVIDPLWSQQAKLVASDGAADDEFGVSVSVSGDTAVVGARLDDAPLTDSGSAYVFVRSGTSWTQQAKLVASDAAADDRFGASVSVSGDTAVVGAVFDNAPLTVSGSAYVFVRSGTSWTQQAKLVASDAAASDQFGLSVSVSGNTAVVGAVFDDAPLSNSGSAYVFVRSGTSWTQQAKLVASDAEIGDQFGWSVSVSGDTAVVGAESDDAPLSGSGSAYVFLRTSVCGDGVLEPGEACDDGNTANGDCCSSVCTFQPATVVCRASAGACDAAETCSGTSGACPVNGFAPSTTTCTGTSNGGLCDGTDRCSGTANTCVDGFATAGTSCRASAGVCDVAETCSGTSGACPVNGFAPSTTTCRPSVGDCDIADTCSGTAATCPANSFRPNGTPCGDVLVCNGVDSCNAGLCVASAPPSCDDANLCTADACGEPGSCTNAPIAGCCNLAADCADDGNVCTSERCSGPGGTCSSVAIANCCVQDADCSGGSTCLAVSCDLTTNRCRSTPVPNCCTTSAECSDGNACTTDACTVDGSCLNVPISGCGGVDGGVTDGGVTDGGTTDDGGVMLDASTPGSDAGDTGVDPVPTPEGGCGCAVPTQRSPSGGLALAVLGLLGLVTARRRRR